jgi:hypothetical protein
MKSSRNWKQYSNSIGKELNNTAGYAWVGTGLLSVLSLCGATAFSSVAAAAVSGVGLVIAGGALVKAAWNAIPPKLRSPDDLVGVRLTIKQADEIAGQLKRMSVVGPTKAGKSTLVKAILSQVFPEERTSGLHAYVVVLPTSPVNYFIMLDGAGGEFSDQFEISRHSDIIIIIYDHDEGDDTEYLDQGRLAFMARFSDQLIGFMNNHKEKKTAWVHLLLNKRDLWERMEQRDERALLAFFAGEETKWKSAKVAASVTSERHSNLESEDIGILIRQLGNHLHESHE